MKRKIVIILLTLALALCAIGLTACSVKDNNSGGETPPAVQSPGGNDDGGDNNGSDDNGGDNNGGDDNGGDNNDGDDNSATEYVSTAGLEYTLSADETYYICSGIGTATATDIVIGSKYNDLPVTSIGDSAFAYCDSLTSVTIPDSVTSIGSEAFYKCSSLKSVTIGNGVTSIGDWAFYKCSKLTSVTIGNGVTSIGSGAFIYCSSLTKVNYLGSIDSWAMIDFYNSYSNPLFNAEDLYINDVLVTKANLTTATYISASAFHDCDSLTSITIPNSVTSIGSLAFSGCSSLKSVTIGNGVTSIGSGAFYGCSSLQYNVYDNAKYLGNENNKYLVLVEANNADITSCEINPNTKVIASYAFRNCSSLESITVDSGNTIYHSAGNCIIETASKTLIVGCKNSVISTDGSVTSIDSYAFYSCYNLTSITIPDSVTSIGYSAFYGCSSLESVTIGNGVTSIGDEAFRNCSSLTSVTIPDSVTSIGNYAFFNCSSLESITVDSGNTIYHSADNCIIETASKTLIVGCKNSVIPTDGSVTSIGEDAFYNCDSLTSVTIPDSVTSIGYSAFSDCSKLTSVTIGNGVTSIGYSAFSDCSKLTSVTIGNGVTSIGDWAFIYCDSLTSITYNGTKAQWNAISKGSDWNSYTGNYTIHCTDGDI